MPWNWSHQVSVVQHALVRQVLRQILSVWEQEGDLAYRLEEWVVPGSPQPMGDDDLHLILSDHDQRDRGKGDERHHCP